MTLLYLLGGNGSQHSWFDNTKPYFDNYEPLSLELPGFGENKSNKYTSLDDLADALIQLTEPDHHIFVVGINSLVVLRALVKHPAYFTRVYMLAPVGAFLWKRKFVKLMRIKAMRKIVHWLLRLDARLFRSKFTNNNNWPIETFHKITQGYRHCRAFQHYFGFINSYDSLKLTEWIETEIELIWGRKDNVLDLRQATAWDSILPRADLKLIVKDDWGHYPYFDDPKEFAEFLDCQPRGMIMHSKAGRINLANLAGILVPRSMTLTRTASTIPIEFFRNDITFAVRSSSSTEDQIDNTKAGLYTSFLDLPINEIQNRIDELFQGGIEEVIVQEYIEPVVSGVAFARNISIEIEWIVGHLSDLVEGKANPYTIIFTKMGKDWQKGTNDSLQILKKMNINPKHLRKFLEQIIEAFHYLPGDIEWAWDGNNFYFLQYRPMQSYQWRRVLTTANLDEILPQQVSRIMDIAQQQAAYSISRVYELWDPRTLEDCEPFTVVYGGASYINMDLFLSRFKDWGLPSKILSSQIGGNYPTLRFSIIRFLLSIPVFVRMLYVARRKIYEIGPLLDKFEEELDTLIQSKSSDMVFVNWFTRYYLFIVQTNIIINALISSAGGSLLTASKTVYSQYLTRQPLHRVPFESDPASYRQSGKLEPKMPFPRFNKGLKLFHNLGFPGFRNKYIEIREWFRDCNMRLFYKLHFALQSSPYFEKIISVRDRSGTFWQSGEEFGQQTNSMMIYPGTVTGTLGIEILVEDALEPGRLELYKTAKAVIARSGGKLSHGSTLLREINKPSAIIPLLDENLIGQVVVFNNGEITKTK